MTIEEILECDEFVNLDVSYDELTNKFKFIVDNKEIIIHNDDIQEVLEDVSILFYM